MPLFQRRRRINVNDPMRPLGLIVPPRGIVEFDDKNNVVRDTVKEDEMEFRRSGRPPVEFEDDDPNEAFN